MLQRNALARYKSMYDEKLKEVDFLKGQLAEAESKSKVFESSVRDDDSKAAIELKAQVEDLTKQLAHEKEQTAFLGKELKSAQASLEKVREESFAKVTEAESKIEELKMKIRNAKLDADKSDNSGAKRPNRG